jgi:hypothetical protein
VRLHPNVVAYLIFAGLNLAAFRALDAERDDRERDRCRTAIETRVEQEVMWTKILERAGADEPTIGILHDGYDGLPEPAGC